MSLYNMIHGYNPACVLILPMLGRRSEEYPRFRDCFAENNQILVYTRVGGGNRNSGFNEDKLYEDENFVTTYDDEDDNTYGYYVFNVPDRWKSDYEYIMNNQMDKVSDEYVNVCKELYPVLTEQGIIDNLFKRGKKEANEESNNVTQQI